MITYIDKGVGMQKAIHQAGYYLMNKNGVWVSSNDVAVQAIINTYNPLPYEQQVAITKINAAIQAQLAKIVAGYPGHEVSTWPQQVSESVAYTANPASPTPMLSSIAVASGQPVSAIASNVLSKAAAYAALSGSLVGMRITLSATIYAATDWKTIKALTAAALISIGV